jgi:hypothetical protein
MGGVSTLRQRPIRDPHGGRINTAPTPWRRPPTLGGAWPRPADGTPLLRAFFCVARGLLSIRPTMRRVLRACLGVGVLAASGCGGGDASTSANPSRSEPPSTSSADSGAGTGTGTGTGTVEAGAPTKGGGGGFTWAFAATSVGFGCNDSFAMLLAKNVTHVTVDGSTIFAGMEQVSANDQDPVVARFDAAGTKVFCEHSTKGGGIDGRAYGVTWDGKDALYVVYTIVGGGSLFDAAAKGGWLSAYGDGGGSSRVAVIGALDASTGVVKRATFVAARVVKNGQTKTNTLVPADAVHVLGDGSLEFFGNPAYCTLNPDKSSMCDPAKTTDYPKDYRARFSADLATMSCAGATGVSTIKQPCP